MPGSRNTLNKQIRQELAGGSDVLDSLNLWQSIRRRMEGSQNREALKLAQLAEKQLHDIRDAMAEHLLNKNDK